VAERRCNKQMNQGPGRCYKRSEDCGNSACGESESEESMNREQFSGFHDPVHVCRVFFFAYTVGALL